MSSVVLVVEDTDLLRRMYADRLSADGYQVIQASNGIEALASLRTHSVDLVLLDLIMPQMSGLEVLELVKRDPRLQNIPVIILSNLGQESDMQTALELGALDYMLKNEAKPADVSRKIKAILKAIRTETVEVDAYRLHIRDREGDSDRLVGDAALSRRFWCPMCEVELMIELVPKPDRHGWYDAHLICPNCDKEF